MKAKLIKQNVENYQKTIRECELAISELRGICEHTDTIFNANSIPQEKCADCGKELPKFHNNQLHYNLVKYSDICTNCTNGNCNCTNANETVKQYFNHT